MPFPAGMSPPPCLPQLLAVYNQLHKNTVYNSQVQELHKTGNTYFKVNLYSILITFIMRTCLMADRKICHYFLYLQEKLLLCLSLRHSPCYWCLMFTGFQAKPWTLPFQCPIRLSQWAAWALLDRGMTASIQSYEKVKYNPLNLFNILKKQVNRASFKHCPHIKGDIFE